jgi:predicted nucleic acid-binding protein
VTLFVDTSAWYAAADAGDRSNRRAKEVLGSGEALVTTDHVLVETWILLRHRLGRAAADRFWDGLRGGVATVEPVGAADLEAARAIRLAFPDQDSSIVDLTSFAVMERLGLRRAAAFDRNFAVYRFGPNRDRAFTVVR